MQKIGYILKDITKIFYELVSIPSPSGSEIEVAEYIKKYLGNLGIKPYFDKTGRLNDSNSGNLIVKLKGSGKTILFIAHMDTVEIGDRRIKTVTDKGIIKSDGKTILGADNKAGIAPLLDALGKISKEKKRNNIIAVFSTREEKGRMGVEFLNLKERIDFGFVIDGSESAGGFINKSRGYLLFKLEIYGKEAHAANDPEKGINAIKIAGIILSILKLGSDGSGITMNIGKVSGGRQANVVPDYVIMEGEIRGYEKGPMDRRFEGMEKIVAKICEKYGAAYKLTVNKEELMDPFASGNLKILNYAKRAAERAGVRFSVSAIKGTTEANILVDRGYPILGISRGGGFPHSKDEYIRIEDMKTVSRLLVALMGKDERP